MLFVALLLASDCTENSQNEGNGTQPAEKVVIETKLFQESYITALAGIKFAAILANGIAVLTALIGGGGMGSMIFEGLTNFNTAKIGTEGKVIARK